MKYKKFFIAGTFILSSIIINQTFAFNVDSVIYNNLGFSINHSTHDFRKQEINKIIQNNPTFESQDFISEKENEQGSEIRKITVSLLEEKGYFDNSVEYKKIKSHLLENIKSEQLENDNPSSSSFESKHDDVRTLDFVKTLKNISIIQNIKKQNYSQESSKNTPV